MTELRLDKLALKNFRCFTEATVSFHPSLTVFVAENGNGKTALLDAASLALSAYINAIYPPERLKKIERSDVRVAPSNDGKMPPCLPTAFAAEGLLAGHHVEWASEVRNYGDKVRPSTRQLRELQTAAQALRTNATVLPLVAFYGTGRLWSEPRLTEGRRTSITDVNERLTGYADCLTSSSSFKGVATWYRHRVQETASPAFRESLSTNLALLGAVREAARTVLKPTGWTNLDWDEGLNSLVADHQKNGRLPLIQLSDGVRTMLALVADVARRCASLNPEFGSDAATKTPGVVLIDEIDMHLHPRWQQLILELLRKAFPELQIIASTHSPHVLSTVDKESIRVFRLADGEPVIATPSLQTRGVESADVLASVMGVDPVPQLPESAQLSQYRSMIEDGQADTQTAVALRTGLVAHFGERHPVILECDRLIRFQQFRVRRDASEGA